MKLKALRIETKPSRLECILEGVHTEIVPALPILERGYVGLRSADEEWIDRLPLVSLTTEPGAQPRRLHGHTNDPVVVCAARRFLATALGLDGAPDYEPGPQPIPTEEEARAELASGRFGFPPV